MDLEGVFDEVGRSENAMKKQYVKWGRKIGNDE
jgi:hypothetical protein